MAQVIKDIVTWLKQWFYTEDEVDTLLNTKQTTLVSGTNIKTINNESVLGSGNIDIQGGSGNVNIVTSWESTLSNSKVPSEKLVKDSLDSKVEFNYGYIDDDLILRLCIARLGLSSSDSVVGTGDTYTLSAKLIDENNEVLETLECVDFIQKIENSDDVLVETSSTNANGIATCQLTGDGSGDKIYYAELNGFISDDVIITDSNGGGLITSVATTLTLTNSQDTLSAYDNDTTTLTATVLDQNGDAMSGESVVFKKGSTTLDTVSTNSNGIATYTYTADGSGDVTIIVECESLTETQTIEDCIYYAPSETSVTRSGTSIWGYWNTGRFSNLPSTYTVEFDMKTSTAPVSNGEQRLYWCPTSQWTGTSTQPKNTVFVGYAYQSGMKFNFGKRLNGTTSAITNPSTTANNWDSVKIAKVNNSGRCDFYLNGTYRDYYTFNNMESYSEFALTYFIWSDTTFSVKNIKIKRTS